MGRNGGCDFSELQAFADSLQTMTNNMSEIMDLCAKELAQHLIGKVIKRTPVGVHSKKSGKKGGTLKKGWSQDGKYKIYHSPSACLIEIKNPIEYASYVEYGHRTVNGGWVPGQLMMTISADEIQRDGPAILEKKIKKWMEANLR